MTKINVDQALRKAKIHEKKNELDEAVKLYNSVLAVFPGNIKAKHGLNRLSQPDPGISTEKKISDEIFNKLISLYNKGQLKTVVQECNRLTDKFPRSLNLWNLLGTALTHQCQFEEAIASFDKALSIKPDHVGTHNNLGALFQAQGRFEEAIAAFSKVLSLKPDYVNAHNNMGVVFQAQGKFVEAIAAFNEVLLIDPNNTKAHRYLSNLKKFPHLDPQIDQMEKLYAGTNLSQVDRCHLCFALAKSSEDLGYVEDAFFYLKEGNALQKNILNYDIAQDKKRFFSLKETASSFRNFSFKDPLEKFTPAPIFVLGMPRSGTTLVEQIISCHSEVTPADELNFLSMFGSSLAEGKVEVNEDNFKLVRTQYLNELKKISAKKSFVTDKLPHNFLYIGLISIVFPEAKIVHVKRSPAATCWSNFKHYFTSKELGYSYNLSDVVHYFRMYEDLMSFWDEHFPGKIYHLDYEQLTTYQEGETKKLIQYLGIDWEDVCLFPEKNKRHVKTASSMQVRKKVYKGSSEKWKMFEKYLDRAFDELLN